MMDNNKKRITIEKIDVRLKVLLIIVLFGIVVAMVLLMPHQQKLTTDIFPQLNESTNNMSFPNISMFEKNNSPQPKREYNYSQSQPVPTNMTCTPYKIAETMFIERMYTSEVQGREIDTTVFPAEPTTNGYVVKSVSSMEYEGNNFETQMKWYYNKNFKCERMDIVMPMGFGTRSFSSCLGYPTGVLCSEMFEGSSPVRTEKHSVSGVEYNVDVYEIGNAEIGVGREVPILFYQRVLRNNNTEISIDLYYVSVK